MYFVSASPQGRSRIHIEHGKCRHAQWPVRYSLIRKSNSKLCVGSSLCSNLNQKVVHTFS